MRKAESGVAPGAVATPRSAPEQNAPPAPVSTITRVVPSPPQPATASRSATIISASTALRTAGWLKAIVVTAPSRVTRSLSVMVWLSFRCRCGPRRYAIDVDATLAVALHEGMDDDVGRRSRNEPH